MATANLLQTSVSGGTQNALSLQGDGVFFPKASTTSRLALTLTTTDKGFIVYDTTDNNIYFWNGAAWESVPSSGDAGANGSVQYNDAGIVSGASNFTYDKATSAVAINGPVNLSLAGTSTVTLGASASYGVLVGSGTNAASIYINGATRPGFNAVLQFGAAEHQFYNSSLSSLIATLNTTAFGIGVAPVAGRGAIQLSAGVGFPAVQVPSSDANCLDDYEEGTWTGTLIGNITTPATPIARTGKYTKIGRQVSITIYFENVDTTGYAGAVSIQGLPFTEDGSRANGTLACYNFDFNGGTSLFVNVGVNTLYCTAALTNSNWRDVLYGAGALRFLQANVVYFV